MAEKQQKTATTKDFVQIADIRDSVLVLKDGSLRSVVEVSSMNFALKSADEQTAIIQAFQEFINSIDFPLQIVVNSRKLDIAPYIKSLDELSAAARSELLRIQVVEYARFIKGLTELANIMSKKFYVSVPFYTIEVATSQPNKTSIFNAFKSVIAPEKFTKTITDEELENYKTQLNQRIEVVNQGINGLGLETKLLGPEDLKNLFYSYYNT